MGVSLAAIGSAIAGAAAASAAVQAGWIVAGGLGFAAIAASVTLVTNVLATKIFGLGGLPDIKDIAPQYLVNQINNNAFIPVIYGERRIAPQRIFTHSAQGTDGINRTLYLVYSICEGEIHDIENIYINDEKARYKDWDQAGAPISGTGTSKYVDTANPDGSLNLLYISTRRKGTDDQEAHPWFVSAMPDKWTSTHRCRGTALLFVKLWMPPAEYNPWNGLPNIKIDVLGRKVYDPRNPSHDADDSTTWEWSDNPAVCLLDYLRNERFGKGIPIAEIDIASFIAAANYCDELVDIPPGRQQKRYTCNGIVDPGNGLLSNVDQLLTSMRGFLVWSAGIYKLKQDKPDAVVAFAFTENNIVGGWSINMGDRASRYNRVRANFFNPRRSWQADNTMVQSDTFLAEDNDERLEVEIQLPFTSDVYMVRQHCTITMKASRENIQCSFVASHEAVQVEVGDVVTITHTTPGWDAKKFRVQNMDITADGDVAITAGEYEEGVYDLDTLDEIDATPDTTLPDADTVLPPGVPQIVEELYSTRQNQVKSRVTVTWEGSEDYFTEAYDAHYQNQGDTVWRPLGVGIDTVRVIDDIAPGVYHFRVRTINMIGRYSEYVHRYRKTVYGLLEPPTEPQGLTISAIASMAVLRWELSEDLDVRNGGKIMFRHSKDESGATWASSVLIGEAVAGSDTVAILPLKAGTYLAKAVDSSGIFSTSAASVSTDGASALQWSNSATVTESPAFSGTLTDVVLSGSPQILKLDSVGDMNSWGLVDSVANWDAEGGIVPEGTYDFAAGIDLGSTTRCRLVTTIGVTITNEKDQIDDRGAPIDEWDDFDGNASGNTADAQVWVRWTTGNPSASPEPTWSEWERLDQAEYEARAFDFKCVLTSFDSAYNIEVDTLKVDAEVIV